MQQQCQWRQNSLESKGEQGPLLSDLHLQTQEFVYCAENSCHSVFLRFLNSNYIQHSKEHSSILVMMFVAYNRCFLLQCGSVKRRLCNDATLTSSDMHHRMPGIWCRCVTLTEVLVEVSGQFIANMPFFDVVRRCIFPT